MSKLFSKIIYFLLLKKYFLWIFLFIAIVHQTDDLISQENKEWFYPEQEIVVAGGYQASNFIRIFAGDHWRNLWITPLKVPVLNLENYAGGLIPTEKGGGMQTLSLKFIGADGRKYKLR